MARFVDLSASAQSAYANAHTAASARSLDRDVGQLRGSFASKDVKGYRYWYFQYTGLDQRQRQLYVGPDDERVRALVMRKTQALSTNLVALSRAAMVQGCEPIKLAHFRVISRLDEYGFFRAGGVLIGTHAFTVMGAMLGVRWQDSTATSAIDFAHADRRQVSIGLPANIEVDTRAAIDSLEMGFLPMVEVGGSLAGSYKKRDEPDFQIDFVVPKGRMEAVQRVAAHGIDAQPLPFLEFLLADTSQATLLANMGAVTVNIPAPARFAVHKLIVAGERGPAYATKARKDLRQAAGLIELLQRDAADDLSDAVSDVINRGKGWVTRYRAGVQALCDAFDDFDAAALPGAGHSRRR